MKQHLIYLREESNPIACVAILNNGANSAYQLSSLSPKDHNFRKPLAREIAEGRLRKHPIAIDLSNADTFHKVANTVIAQLSVSTETPTRVKRVARRHTRELLAKQDAIVINDTPLEELGGYNMKIGGKNPGGSNINDGAGMGGLNNENTIIVDTLDVEALDRVSISVGGNA